MPRHPPRSPLFPYTTLFRSYAHGSSAGLWSISASGGEPTRLTSIDSSKGEGEHTSPEALPNGHTVLFTVGGGSLGGDRKSTRLNSSHLGISYAVFCLKKKKK